MKKYIYSLLLIISVFGAFVYADDGGYTIKSYYTNMSINTDGSMDVSEKIGVNFAEARHGIYRQIPNVDPQGDRLKIENFSSDQPIANKSISDGYYQLKLGSAGKTIIGSQSYGISYTVKNAIKAYSGTGSQSGRTELYRNILGNKRDTSISGVNFMISIPKSYIFASGDIGIVYGYYGDKLTSGAVIYQSGNYIYGYIDHVLSSNIGATIGLKFPTGYFQVNSNYNSIFVQDLLEKIGRTWHKILLYILLIIAWSVVYFYGPFSISFDFKLNYKTPRKSDDSITIYYKPPVNISPNKAFWFWYNSKNPKIFTAVLYYRCTSGRAKISKIQGEKGWFGIRTKDRYHIIETSTRPNGTDAVDDALLQGFFGNYDDVKNDITMNQDSYTDIDDLLSKLSDIFELENIYYTQKTNIFSIFGGGKAELTEEGKKLFEQLRGYQEYLTKVEKPVLEAELKADPDFFNKTLPWAVLFGVSTKLLEVAEDILAKADWYDSYDNMPLTPYIFSSMNNSIKTFSIAPRSDSSGSGFGGSSGGSFGGSSGGGGGGGGGGSW